MRTAWPLVVVAACGHPAPVPAASGPPAASPTAAAADAPAATQDEKLAAIQKAMNDLSPAAQQCWAAAATERFDIEGEVAMRIDIADGTATAMVAHDTTKSKRLGECMSGVLAKYRWAPPLRGESIELPFKFSAPDGQSVIDRQLVPWAGQGKVSAAVLLDENNTGNGAASMLEVAIAAGGTTEMRYADRAELWYFQGDAVVKAGKTVQAVAAGDMMFVPKDGVREVLAPGKDVHAVVVVVPGGREGSARAGALPNRAYTPIKTATVGFTYLPAASAKAYGPATIFVDDSIAKGTPLAASILALPAGAKVPEHVHAKETELLYVLDGSGTMTVAGTDVAVTPTSVIQIPPNTKHAFAATAAVRAVQIYTPAGPEQRFKKPPKQP